jgi:hypothetical protein
MNHLATWPAPAAPSTWQRCTLRYVPVQSAYRPPARAATRPAKRSGLVALRGIASRFGVWFSPCVIGMPSGTRVLVADGALDRSLRRIAAGRHEVPLTLNHQGHVLLTTAQGLEVYVRGETLRIKIRPETRTARDAIRLLRHDWPSSALSATLTNIQAFTLADEALKPHGSPVSMAVIMTADLFEIAVVESGACPNCHLIL